MTLDARARSFTAPDGFTTTRSTQLVAGAGSRLYESWLHSTIAIRSSHWPGTMPLVLVRDSLGAVVDSFGRVRHYPGVTLTHAMNRGIVRFHRDTVWFARRVDGVILGFPTGAPSPDASVAIEVPLVHPTLVPREWVGPEPQDLVHLLSDHILAFDVAPDGDMFLLRAAEWATLEADGRFGPKAVVLSTVSGTSREHRLFTIGDGYASAVAATRLWVVMIAIDASGDRHVKVFENPLQRRGYATPRC